MAKRPLKGLSIQEAFRRYAGPVLLARLDELEPYANEFTVGVTEQLFNEYHDTHAATGEGLVQRLERGELIARGLVPGAPVPQGKVDVDPERWAELEIDHELDEIVGPKGFVMTAVEIREAEPDETPDQVGAANADRPARAGPSGQHSAGKAAVHLAENGEVLTVGVTRMVFRGNIHKAIISQLVEAHAKDEWVRTADLLQNAKSKCDTLAKAFSRSRNWPSLKKVLRHCNGYTWLEA
jgi:hypothetical protein